MLTSYTFRTDHTYPYVLESNITGVTIQVANATESSHFNSVNVISTLSAMSVSILNGSSLQCKDNFGAISAIINITAVSLGIITA